MLMPYVQSIRLYFGRRPLVEAMRVASLNPGSRQRESQHTSQHGAESPMRAVSRVSALTEDGIIRIRIRIPHETRNLAVSSRRDTLFKVGEPVCIFTDGMGVQHDGANAAGGLCVTYE